MFAPAAAILLAVAVRASPPEARETELPLVPELRRLGLNHLADFALHSNESKVREYMRSAPRSYRPDEIRQFHSALDEALSGKPIDIPGRPSQGTIQPTRPLDASGEDIRWALERLPPGEWYFVAELLQTRRFILGNAGVSGWDMNMVDGQYNVPKHKLGELNKCRARTQFVRDLMTKSRLPAESWRFSAAVTLLRSPLGKFTQHNAGCFSYEAEGGPVELVLDAWKGDLIRADVWWEEWDRGSAESIYQQCGRFCGPCYCDWLVDSTFIFKGKDPAAIPPEAKARELPKWCPDPWTVAGQLGPAFSEEDFPEEQEGFEPE